jgi:hypothetical protein
MHYSSIQCSGINSDQHGATNGDYPIYTRKLLQVLHKDERKCSPSAADWFHYAHSYDTRSLRRKRPYCLFYDRVFPVTDFGYYSSSRILSGSSTSESQGRFVRDFRIHHLTVPGANPSKPRNACSLSVICTTVRSEACDVDLRLEFPAPSHFLVLTQVTHHYIGLLV